jgi:hypothetical protein
MCSCPTWPLSLQNLGAFLGALGQSEAALEAAREATEIRDRLAVRPKTS